MKLFCKHLDKPRGKGKFTAGGTAEPVQKVYRWRK